MHQRLYSTYFLMIQIHDSNSLSRLNMIWIHEDLPKTLIYPNFDPMDVSKGQNIKHKKISNFCTKGGLKSESTGEFFHCPKICRKLS